MRSHDPILLHRMLELRQFPIFSAPELEELVNVAENVVEVEHARGETVAAAGARVDALHLIVEGRLEAVDRARAWGPREPFGLLEAFARRTQAIEIIAAADSRVLRLSTVELIELLEDNHGLMTAALRELASRATARGARIAGARADEVPARALGLIDRLRILRRQTPFAAARLQALTRLAHGTEEKRWPPGAELTSDGVAASLVVVIVEGAVRAERSDGSARTHHAGEAVGLLEALAGEGGAPALAAIAPVRALVARIDDVLDVVEDHPDLGLAMLRTFSTLVLDA